MMRDSLLGVLAVLLPVLPLEAGEDYTARTGKISFTVGTNVPLVKVSGASPAVTGRGAATVADNVVEVRNLHFEVEPTTFHTGLKLRDQHLYEKVFRAADGSMPNLVLQAARFEARLNPRTQRWEGDLQGLLTMRGVTRPVQFRVSGQKKGAGAIIVAEGRVKTSDFGVKPISNAITMVKDEVAIVVSDLWLVP